MIQLIRGVKDILPGEIGLWQKIEKTAISLFESFGFCEIRLPIIEHTELFARSIGQDTDIVEKEMYTFLNKKDEMITLRPEATASIVRAYIQHRLYAIDPVQKFYTIGPMFRRERPQKGRYRQFYQINAEVLGVDSPLTDAQLIFMLVELLKRLSVPDVCVYLNSLGCPVCRPGFKKSLQKFMSNTTAMLCSDCERRKEKNPLRVLDCKVLACREAMKDAPSIIEHLCNECEEHFEAVKNSLNDLNIQFEIDKRLVRGLDYYTRTTFEVHTGSLGAQSAVAGGGRYDRLIESLGGPSQPAIGFAIGFDRLAEIISSDNAGVSCKPDLFIAALGEQARTNALKWSCALSLSGIKTETDFSDKGLKGQMKKADRLAAGHVLIIGDNELSEGSAILRNMMTKEQVSVPIDGIVEKLKSIFV
ncbi:histidine--tRNA ligase [Desulfobacterium sp. N47]|uniref:Histidine--tRNA ligase n=1 Tax=uncultured Desulfobacterium sp. TaxID=201089 RepID=E1YE45_9BACT|nr:Histidyl-tRNA synthetase [uncultured Desulfobacterium sp.]